MRRRPLATLMSEDRDADLAVRTLYAFDFDDTLVHSPPVDSAKEVTKSRSLDGRKIIAKTQVKGAYQRARRDHAGYVLVMTGRVGTPEMKKAVQAALTRGGYPGHKLGRDLFLKPPKERDTGAWKKKMLRGLMLRFPNARAVHMWDDRGDHVVQFKQQIADLGRVGHVVHVAESWPNTPAVRAPYARDERYPAKAEKPVPEAPIEEPEQPLDNPGPGNVNARTMVRAAGSKMHKQREPVSRPVSAKLHRRKLRTPIPGTPA